MSLRTVLYSILVAIAALVVASATATLEGQTGTPVVAPADATVAITPWDILSGDRGLALLLGVGALGFMYHRVWLSYRR
jgi:hypothetical protein